MDKNILDFNKILNFILMKNYNGLINYLYNNITSIINLIQITDNPQPYDEFDIYTAIYYYSSNKVDPEDTYIIPIIINRLVHYIIRKKAYLELDGNNEIAYQNHYKFYTNTADNDIKMKLLILQIIFFYFESLHEYQNRKMYFVGIDFEFNSQKIALCQICFFPRKSRKYIWIFDPRELDNEQRKYVIKYLYVPENIYKILHGSDSLDIPYLFNTFFKKNKTTILKFISRVIDTRFICEYEKIASKYSDKKCSIYDALKYFGTITEKKYNELNNITNKMGKVYQIIWNIHNMSQYHIEYALYDVLFLREFLFDTLRKSKRDNPSIHKNLELIPEITRFVFLEKWDIEKLLSQLKYETDLINNFYILNNKHEHTLIYIYNYVINNLNDNTIIFVNDLLNINYFKSSLTLLFKYIIYSIITNNYIIYENKNNVYNNKLNYNLLFTYFKELKMNRIINLLDEFVKSSREQIKKYLDSQ